MTLRTLLAAAALAAAALASPAPALAQAGATVDKQDCAVLPDTFRAPTPGQVADRRKLRAQLDSIGRAFGVAEPKGLLLVDVDSARKGALLFLDSNYPQEGIETATHFMGAYLSTLPKGRPYQALVRIDGDYPAMGPGKRHCRPEISDTREFNRALQAMVQGHPSHGKVSAPVERIMTVLLVVNREGGVSYVAMDATGDPYLDERIPDVVKLLRFHPAKLDAVPFDARFRYRFNVVIQ